MRRLAALVLIGAVGAGAVQADELDELGSLTQPEFRLLGEDLALALAYKGMQPAEPYGSIGFDIAVEASGVRLAHETLWRRAGVDQSTVVLTRVSATKGLPLGFDIGGFAATAPGTGMRAYGGQLRYALSEGGIATPAVGLRAAVTRLEGVTQLDATTRSVDLSISKGFGPLTPYAGYGRVWAEATPARDTGLADERIDGARAFAGLRFSLLLLEFGLEAERMHDATGYALKAGFAF